MATRRKARRKSHARRKGKMPAGLAAYHAKRKAKRAKRRAHRKARVAANPTRSKPRRRPSKHSRMKARRNRARRRVKNVPASAGSVVVVRKVAVGKVRRARRRSGRRVGAVGVNPGSMSLAGGLTHLPANFKATWKDGIKGMGFAALGAGATVFAGTMVSRVTTQIVGKFAPKVASSEMGSRVLAGANYYLAGWAVAKYVPGLSPKSRRAMLAGAAAVAILEVIKPNLVRRQLASLPIVGSVFGGTLSGLADDLGAYVAYSLNGLGSNGDGGGHHYTADLIEGRESDGMNDYVALNDAADGDAAGMNDYVALR